ncbi:MAG: energy transducer TonB [Terrimicrobiaceae bacterium]
MNSLIIDWRESTRKKTFRAVILSVILHLLLIMGIALVVGLQPPTMDIPEEEETIQVTMVDPPKPAGEEPQYLSTVESQRSNTAPENPAFESDKDTRAASEAAATGDVPLPSQDGEESPATQFEDREFTAGKEPQPSSPASEATQPAEPPAPEQAQPKPTPRQPASEIALLQPVRPQATPRPTPEEVEPPKPETQPASPALPGYQPQTRVTRLKGNISNRGRAAADAVATPLGRYKKQLSDAIGSRWYYYVNDAISLLNTGTLKLRFVVLQSGKVQRVEVLRNSSNESFASTSVRAVMEAEIPPIPEEILPMLKDGKIEVDYTFTILPN